MTSDDIIKMAREVGSGEPNNLFGRTDYFVFTQFELERFATLIAEAKFKAAIEMCAKRCEQQIDEERMVGFEVDRVFSTAHKIRALK